MRPEILNPLFKQVSSLEGIGPKLEKALTRLFRGSEQAEAATLRDLLFHRPHSIIDRRRQPGIANAPEGVIVTLKVRVDRHQPPPRGNTRVPYRVFVHDETGELALVFFRAHGNWLDRMLPVGETRHVSGRVEWFNGRPTMIHPDHIVDEAEFAAMPLVEPVYPNTSGMAQKSLQKAIRSAVEQLPDLPEWIDPALREREGWPDFRQAVERLHEPRDALDLEPSAPHRRRLAFDEFLSGQIALALMRERMRKAGGRKRESSGKMEAAILNSFAYPLTAGQSQAIADIKADQAKPERMLRLLQGDVGSGKTIVALMAAANAIEAGSQAAIMAPTEILARQHFASIAPLAEAAGIRCAILTGRERGKAREAILSGLNSGDIDLLVGTHALFQGPVSFKDLGLAVIDEQHRFGVHQRLALGDKSPHADVLVMTATPIPRTLVMTWYGDMEVSKLTEKPAGRREIATSALPLDRLDELIARIGKAIAEGQKVYWVCPLVEDSEEVDATSAEERHAALARVFGNNAGLVHGRMRAEEKDAAMLAFRDGGIRILVATTVIEVGVDVPDATIIVIENAERFGLAQMHQLRGRVGRSDRQSHCILLYKSPLGVIATERLKTMRETNDGFLIAEKDLKLRGEGEILGTRQSGAPGFNLASAEHHGDVLEMARDAARLAIHRNPDLSGPGGEALRNMLYLFGQDQAVRLLRSG
ncbi:MAG: ATP-dependent DNA helicase RecG [Nitratireductor sp.]|nr:ATP-dependent DNA helicase RecG [Nitratireductor sp.]MCC0019645.1 ATP-dependent DNA helicase RecG [Nitratireductor sp.]